MEFNNAMEMLKKTQSFKTVHRNPKYGIENLTVKVTTTPNKAMFCGGIEDDVMYFNKSFFNAMGRGLRFAGVKIPFPLDISNFNELAIENLYAYKLAEMSRMLNDVKTDIYNYNHLQIIENLAKTFKIRIEFYFGLFKEDSWYTTPDPEYYAGCGNTIIKIFIEGDHFEFIEKLEPNFAEKLSGQQIERSIRHQQNILNSIQKTRGACERPQRGRPQKRRPQQSTYVNRSHNRW